MINDKLLSMAMLYQSVDEKLKVGELSLKFGEFYDENPGDGDLSGALVSLEQEGLIEVKNGLISLPDAGMMEGNRRLIKFFYSEGVQKSEKSPAEALYRKGKSPGQVNSDSIVDEEQLDYILSLFADCRNGICDLGCGRGELTTYMSRKSGLKFIGVDKSGSMIDIARGKNREITWIQADLEEGDEYLEGCDGAVMIDSLYFIRNKELFLDNLMYRLREGGPAVITWSCYTEDPCKKDTLTPEGTEIAQLFQSMGLRWDFRDFTANEISYWERCENLADSLKDRYRQERNSLLYFDKKSESSSLLGVLRQGLGRRYIYSVFPPSH